MKKAYMKPEIMFESFASSMNIALAADCEYATNMPTNNSCGLEWGDSVLFLDSMGNACTGDGIVKDTLGGDGAYGKICYHIPYGNNLFNS